MARTTIIKLVDDLDGTELDEGQGETLAFTIDGQAYELDLSNDNAKKVRDTFGKYVGAARKVSKAASSSSGRRHTTGASRSDQDRERTKQMREWAVERGFLKADSRGRLPGKIVEAYEQHQRGEQITVPGLESVTTPATPAPAPAKVNGKSKSEPAKGAETKDTPKVPATA